MGSVGWALSDFPSSREACPWFSYWSQGHLFVFMVILEIGIGAYGCVARISFTDGDGQENQGYTEPLDSPSDSRPEIEIDRVPAW